MIVGPPHGRPASFLQGDLAPRTGQGYLPVQHVKDPEN